VHGTAPAASGSGGGRQFLGQISDEDDANFVDHAGELRWRGGATDGERFPYSDATGVEDRFGLGRGHRKNGHIKGKGQHRHTRCTDTVVGGEPG